jgi:hypothetical protein
MPKEIEKRGILINLTTRIHQIFPDEVSIDAKSDPFCENRETMTKNAEMGKL